MKARQRPPAFMPESGKWLEELKASGKSDRTIECYSRDLCDVAEATGASKTGDLLCVDQEAIDVMTRAWRNAGTCMATASRRFSALRGFAAHLVREHHLDLSLLLSADFPSAKKGTRRPLDEQEIDALLVEKADDTWRDLRDSAVFAVQSSSGLTPSEAVALDVSDVDLKKRLVCVRETHLTERLVGLSEQSERLISDYLLSIPFALRSTDPLFVISTGGRLSVRSVQLSFRRRRMRLGIAGGAFPMGLRHAVAARLANEGASPAILASALGVSRTTVSRYFETDD
jgi:integrase/recombinase XerC